MHTYIIHCNIKKSNVMAEFIESKNTAYIGY